MRKKALYLGQKGVALKRPSMRMWFSTAYYFNPIFNIYNSSF